MIKLFEMGDNNMAQLNKEWISLIPEFRRLLARDKGGPGDGSGKYKKQAQREFTFIFLMFDFHSPIENLEENERMQKALEMSELTRGKVESDGDLYAAMRKYQWLLDNSSVTLQTYRDLRSSVDDLRFYIKGTDLNERTAMGAKVHSPKEKQEAINGMPKTMGVLAALEKQVKDELKGDTGLRGDATKGEDEDPDEDDY